MLVAKLRSYVLSIDNRQVCDLVWYIFKDWGFHPAPPSLSWQERLVYCLWPIVIRTHRARCTNFHFQLEESMKMVAKSEYSGKISERELGHYIPFPLIGNWKLGVPLFFRFQTIRSNGRGAWRRSDMLLDCEVAKEPGEPISGVYMSHKKGWHLMNKPVLGGNLPPERSTVGHTGYRVLMFSYCMLFWIIVLMDSGIVTAEYHLRATAPVRTLRELFQLLFRWFFSSINQPIHPVLIPLDLICPKCILGHTSICSFDKG